MALAIIGDVHMDFDEVDVRLLDQGGYDAILFVGDLASLTHRGGLQVAKVIASLRTPTYLIPGNHDTVHVGQLAAEVIKAEPLIPLLGFGHEQRADELRHALAPAEVVGFSRHPLVVDGVSLDLIAARPHSVGGTQFAYRPFLRARYGVGTFEASIERLSALVDSAPSRDLLFLAHNGPYGLGATRADIWGCDFRREEGDFGDWDLAEAVDHARRRGKRVRAVVAGHMHHELRGGGQRTWQVRDRDILYVNAARVPRIFEDAKGRVLRHHVRLRLDAEEGAVAEEVLLAE